MLLSYNTELNNQNHVILILHHVSELEFDQIYSALRTPMVAVTGDIFQAVLLIKEVHYTPTTDQLLLK
jgi:thioester reductase-like protein